MGKLGLRKFQSLVQDYIGNMVELGLNLEIHLAPKPSSEPLHFIPLSSVNSKP